MKRRPGESRKVWRWLTVLALVASTELPALPTPVAWGSATDLPAAQNRGTYYFRLTNAGTAFDAYDVIQAVITMQAAPAGPLPLHAADVVVGSTTYNTVNSTPVAGTLATASAAISGTGVKALADAAAISIFASDAVPAGTIIGPGER